MKAFRNNNEQLLTLLEKYDDKVTELQTEIDVRDLRIEELEDKPKKYTLKSLEDRVQFLIDLLEKCKTQLGYISDTDSHVDKNKAASSNTGINKKYANEFVNFGSNKQLEQDEERRDMPHQESLDSMTKYLHKIHRKPKWHSGMLHKPYFDFHS